MDQIADAKRGETQDHLTKLTVKVVSAYVSHNALGATDVARAISEVHAALRVLGTVGQPIVVEELVPAVPARKSVTPDYIVCLDDGKKFKSLKRHIAGLGMTPDQYRTKWSLPRDYPMVAPNYSATRSTLAKQIGLGKKPVEVKPKAVGPKRKAKAKA